MRHCVSALAGCIDVTSCRLARRTCLVQDAKRMLLNRPARWILLQTWSSVQAWQAEENTKKLLASLSLTVCLSTHVSLFFASLFVSVARSAVHSLALSVSLSPSPSPSLPALPSLSAFCLCPPVHSPPPPPSCACLPACPWLPGYPAWLAVCLSIYTCMYVCMYVCFILYMYMQASLSSSRSLILPLPWVV